MTVVISEDEGARQWSRGFSFMFELNDKDIIVYYLYNWNLKNYVDLKVLKEVFKTKVILLKASGIW